MSEETNRSFSDAVREFSATTCSSMEIIANKYQTIEAENVTLANALKLLIHKYGNSIEIDISELDKRPFQISVHSVEGDDETVVLEFELNHVGDKEDEPSS